MVSEWKYDPGVRRMKHKWGRNEAGFYPEGAGACGQCPSSVANVPGLAKKLLNGGIPWPSGVNPPNKIYNVYQGVVYRAEPTENGVSYHGFPEREWKSRFVDQEVLEELAKRSDDANEYHLFERWMKRHLPVGWKRLRYKSRNLSEI